MKKLSYLNLAFLLPAILLSMQPAIPQTFEEQTGISLTNVSLSSVDWGDYNNDGYLDILLTGYSSSNRVTKIFKNNGNNTFTEQTSIILTGLSEGSAKWGDCNNDGYLDIFVTGYWASSKTISKVYKNNGDNSFTELTEFSIPGIYRGTMSWGDYNNDGNLDILLTGAGVSKIYRNYGDNTFAEETGISLTPIAFGSSAWGDYNNDGYLDILITGDEGGSNFISKIYKNNGDNTFTEQTGISMTGVYLSSVAWGDYNNDGYLDILLTGSSNAGLVSKIYKNNGDNTFTEQTGIILTGIDDGSVAWGDYNNDGYLDILLAGYSGVSAVSKIYKNNGDNTFTEQTGISLTGVESCSAVWGDYDNDGDLDILLTGIGAGSSRVTKIYKNLSLAANSNPTAPINLQSTVNGKSIVLNWGKGSDNETSQNTLSYNLYVSDHSMKETVKTAMANLSNGYRKVAELGNITLANEYTLKNPTGGQTYYWSVQTIDQAFQGGVFAAEQSFEVQPLRPTIQASDIVCTAFTDTSISLKWTIGNGPRRAVFFKQNVTGTTPLPSDHTALAVR